MREKVCPTCKKVFKWQGESKNYWKVRRYCSIKCSNTLFKKGTHHGLEIRKGQIGVLSPSFKGGRNIATNGYVRVLIPGTRGYEGEHRLVMEKHLGRKLVKGEVVHHINGIKTDNRIENLTLMNKRDHDRYETTRR